MKDKYYSILSRKEVQDARKESGSYITFQARRKCKMWEVVEVIHYNNPSREEVSDVGRWSENCVL